MSSSILVHKTSQTFELCEVLEVASSLTNFRLFICWLKMRFLISVTLTRFYSPIIMLPDITYDNTCIIMLSPVISIMKLFILPLLVRFCKTNFGTIFGKVLVRFRLVRYLRYLHALCMAFNTVITVPAEISRGPFRKSYRNSFCKTSLFNEVCSQLVHREHA